MNDKDFIEKINCHGYALHITRVIPEEKDIPSIDAYIFLNKLDKIKTPEPGCIIAFRTPKVINKTPFYIHTGVIYTVNPLWITHKGDYNKLVQQNTLKELLLELGYKGDKIFYFRPKKLYELYYSYMEIRSKD